MKNKLIVLVFVTTLLTCITALLLSSATPAVDIFKVIKVDGKIAFVKSGKDLTVGDQFNSDEKLNFLSENSRAAVISKTKGRFILTAQSKGGTTYNMVPALANVETRGGTLLNDLDLKNYFSNRFLLMTQQVVKVSKTSYPLSEESYFYLQYEYNGEKVAKKLQHKGTDTLELSAKNIFTIDGKKVEIPLETKVTLYYKNGNKNKTYKINTFQLIIPNNQELISELKLLIEELGNKSQVDKQGEIMAFLFEFYGKPQKENVIWWLNEYLNF